MGFAEIPGYCYNDAGNKKVFFFLVQQNLRKRKGVKR